MKADLVRVKHMADAASEILEFVSGKSRSDLDENRMFNLSVVHLLEIIGEAANKVTSEFRETYDDIQWKSIIGMRNRLIHGYFDIDLDIVWKTITSDIPILSKKLKRIIEAEENGLK